MTDVRNHSNNSPHYLNIKFQNTLTKSRMFVKFADNALKYTTVKKLFKCSFCDKRFYHKIYLNVRENIHTDKRPYKCTRCQKGFNQKSNLTSHQQSCFNRRLPPSEQLVGDTKFELGHSPAEMQISRDVSQISDSHNTIVNSSKSVDISTKSSFTNNF